MLVGMHLESHVRASGLYFSKCGLSVYFIEDDHPDLLCKLSFFSSALINKLLHNNKRLDDQKSGHFSPSVGQNAVGPTSYFLDSITTGSKQELGCNAVVLWGQGIPQSLRSGSKALFLLMPHDTLDPKAINPNFSPPGDYK